MRPAHRQLFTADDGEGIPCPGNLPDIHKIALVDSDKIAGKLGLQVIQLTPEAFFPAAGKGCYISSFTAEIQGIPQVQPAAACPLGEKIKIIVPLLYFFHRPAWDSHIRYGLSRLCLPGV